MLHYELGHVTMAMWVMLWAWLNVFPPAGFHKHPICFYYYRNIILCVWQLCVMKRSLTYMWVTHIGNSPCDAVRQLRSVVKCVEVQKRTKTQLHLPYKCSLKCVCIISSDVSIGYDFSCEHLCDLLLCWLLVNGAIMNIYKHFILVSTEWSANFTDIAFLLLLSLIISFFFQAWNNCYIDTMNYIKYSIYIPANWKFSILNISEKFFITQHSCHWWRYTDYSDLPNIWKPFFSHSQHVAQREMITTSALLQSWYSKLSKVR